MSIKSDQVKAEILSDQKVRELLNTEGVYLAGGAVRDAFLEVTPKDYDFYFRSVSDFNIASSYMNKIAFKENDKISHNEYVSSYEIDGIKYQLIHKYCFSNIDRIYKDFDFNFCCAAFDGKELSYTKKFLEDIEEHEITINVITRPVSSLQRLIKFYRDYEFNCDDSYRYILNLMLSKGIEIINLTDEYDDAA